MVTAFVFISVDPERIPEAAQQVAEVEQVSEVYSVTGDIDLIAVVKVREFDMLTEAISDRISKVPGVRDTCTHMAFRAYNKQDLEAGFAL